MGNCLCGCDFSHLKAHQNRTERTSSAWEGDPQETPEHFSAKLFNFLALPSPSDKPTQRWATLRTCNTLCFFRPLHTHTHGRVFFSNYRADDCIYSHALYPSILPVVPQRPSWLKDRWRWDFTWLVVPFISLTDWDVSIYSPDSVVPSIYLTEL